MADNSPQRLQIKVLDASKFLSGVGTDRKVFAEELVQALKQDGFVKIINHGISRSMVTDAMAVVRGSTPLTLAFVPER